MGRHGGFDRRQFMKVALHTAGGAALLAMLGRRGAGSLVETASAASLTDGLLATWKSTNKLKHIVILCQENRSFDHYFGSFGGGVLGTPGNRPAVFDPTVTYANSAGARFAPYHITEVCDFDPDHTWAGSHAKWNGGAMNGWITGEVGESTGSLGYYEQADHIYHVQLAQAFTLCDQYFCSMIGPTLPNRLYLWSGTSGFDYLGSADGTTLPYDNPGLTDLPLDSLTWPTLADVLSAHGLPWKSYSVVDGSVPSTVGAFNPLIFFKSIAADPIKLARSLCDISEFFVDALAGTLPAVSFIVTEALVSEHPPAPPDFGQLLAARVVRALLESPAWESTALFLTYDEGGGHFEHVAPTILETVPAGMPNEGQAVGPGFRVPTTIVSPYARPNTIFSEPLDHTSILQFIEDTFSLPHTLPIHPARRANLNNLADAFDFTRSVPQPALPSAADLYALAKETVLTTDVSRTVVECSTTIPDWLPELLGV